MVPLLREESPNDWDEDGRTPMHIAVELGYIQIVKTLLSSPEIALDVPDSEMKTPLASASASGYTEIAKLLLSHSAEPDPCDLDHRTPLSWAAANGHVAVVDLLLTQVAIDMNRKDGKGMTALCHAAAAGHTSVVKRLLAEPKVKVNTQDKRGRTPLCWALKKQHASVAKILVSDRRVNVTVRDKKTGRDPLLIAAENGRRDVVEALLQRPDIDLNAYKDAGLTYTLGAIEGGKESIFRLIQSLSNINTEEFPRRAVTRAAKFGYNKVVEHFLRPQQLPDVARIEPWLLDAIFDKLRSPSNIGSLLLPACRRLIEGNTKRIEGNTNRAEQHFDFADETWMDEKAVVHMLFKNSRINPNAKDKDELTPLFYAARHSQYVTARLLIEMGADPNVRDPQGRSPLAHLDSLENSALVGLLLEHCKPEGNSKLEVFIANLELAQPGDGG
jgi:ankyrin repeat protein